MPYIVRREGDKYKVYTQGEDGNPKGTAHGTFDTEQEAKAQQRALYANTESESKKMEKISERKDVSEADKKRAEGKYGDVSYADEKNKKYPIDTPEHIRAAWSYIGQERNQEKYSPDEVASIKRKIVAAWKSKIDKDGPPAAEEKKDSQKAATALDSIHTWAVITKINQEERTVEGIASTENPDEQAGLWKGTVYEGDVVDAEAVKEALPDYMQWANIREMHQPSAVGVALDANIIGKQLLVKAKIIDDPAWNKVRAGVYKGFSIGGKVVEAEIEKLANRIIRRISKLKLTEISLVDRPANPDARILLWKGEDMDGVPAPIPEGPGGTLEAESHTTGSMLPDPLNPKPVDEGAENDKHEVNIDEEDKTEEAAGEKTPDGESKEALAKHATGKDHGAHDTKGHHSTADAGTAGERAGDAANDGDADDHDVIIGKLQAMRDGCEQLGKFMAAGHYGNAIASTHFARKALSKDDSGDMYYAQKPGDVQKREGGDPVSGVTPVSGDVAKIAGLEDRLAKLEAENAGLKDMLSKIPAPGGPVSRIPVEKVIGYNGATQGALPPIAVRIEELQKQHDLTQDPFEKVRLREEIAKLEIRKGRGILN